MNSDDYGFQDCVGVGIKGLEKLTHWIHHTKASYYGLICVWRFSNGWSGEYG